MVPWTVDRSQSLFYFVPQEKNVNLILTAKQVWLPGLQTFPQYFLFASSHLNVVILTQGPVIQQAKQIYFLFGKKKGAKIYLCKTSS